MKYTEEMMMRSASGYCMPFEERGKDVEMSLGYGEQEHPATGEAFFHHGVDFNVKYYPLAAVASGNVCAVGSDDIYGIYMTLRYGKYEVMYGHLSNVFANFGHPVKAGQVVAVSGDMLHVGVKFDGQELNPLEFLTMLYGNVKASSQPSPVEREFGNPFVDSMEMGLPTKYEKDREEIEELMMRFLPVYMHDLRDGQYAVPEHTEQSLRNIFSVCATKNYFFETMPSMTNPLGIGSKIMPLACKVQNMLIADFLNYLALRHGVFLSSIDENLKKKVEAEAIASSGIIDPLAELDVDIQSFDIPRMVSVYPDHAGVRWWTKAWFNNRENGEAAVEIEEQLAVQFIHDRVDKDEWLEEHFPKLMEVYHNAIEQTKEQLFSYEL